MLTAAQTIARCLLRRQRAWANTHYLYWGMGCGVALHAELRPIYLWRMAHRAPNPQVRAVALALHQRLVNHNLW